ncbi:MAG: calcium-dependent protein kinase [Methanofollis sp.]|uniref:calcium-dependent protein kinase n=1 Tax=Methanofollis sp. TaxID=2052835 RepID=UPI00263161DD|nr:calcium-dependent protein kinase [Methanofollis sp.]MDD4255613.1 calcium-dependent protein kinase [Methanofollis sp.]
MKKTYILLAGILVLVSAVAVYSLFLTDEGQRGSLPTIQGSAETEFDVMTDFPAPTDTSYPVYGTDVPAVTVQSVEKIAGLFGMTGNAEVCNQKTGEIQIVDESKENVSRLSMYPPSGAILYEIPDKEFPAAVREQPVLPSRDEAIQIANVFLKERGLLPSEAKVSTVEVNQQQEVWKAGGSEPERVYSITLAVRYARTLDGVPVYGDEMAVIIGDGGEVVGMVKCWRPVEATGETMIIPAEKAYENLKAEKTVIPQDMAGYDRISIENISLGYWMKPRIYEQKTVTPVWAFSGTAYYDGKEEPYLNYVSAVPEGA